MNRQCSDTDDIMIVASVIHCIARFVVIVFNMLTPPRQIMVGAGAQTKLDDCCF